MRVAKVLDSESNAVSFTLIGATGMVDPAERYLRYLAETERSPNTIKAHAHDLKDWFVFLDEYGRDWNRKLSTVSIVYQHAARHGLDLGELITCWDPDR
jgi:integrase/recombinase XerD